MATAGNAESLFQILARAASPDERLAGGWLAVADNGSGVARYDAWLHRIADGRPERAAEILALRGLDRDSFTAGLSDVVPVPGAPLPAWACAVLELFAAAGDPAAGADDDVPSLGEVAGPGLPAWVDPEMPWRFQRGFRAWLADARRRVDGWTETYRAPLGPSVRRSLALSLTRRLLPVVGPRLMERAASRPPGPALFEDDPAADWLALFDDTPVAARLLAVAWLQWRDATEELLRRVGADLPGLAPNARVAAIELGAGDRHAAGRSVAVVHLDDRRTLFLKPHPAGPQQAIAGLFAAVDAAGPPFGLTLPRTEPRDGYTWAWEVVRGECRDPAEVDAYFYRAGALLRILQAVGATDLHHENFVVTRGQPVLVDLETLLGPGGWADGGHREEDALAAVLADTPAATSMVTSPVDGPAGTTSVDLGAMAGPHERLTPYEVASLVLTPRGPELQRRRVPLVNGSALPVLDGSPVPVREHVRAVLDGYGEAQRRLCGGADLGRAVAGADVRFVPRATQIYSRLLAQSLSAAALTDGVERELVLELLWRAAGTCPPALIAAEQLALRELDVPRFTVPLTGTGLVTDRGTVIRDVLAESPADVARRRLAAVGSRRDHADDLRAALFAADPASEPAAPSRPDLGTRGLPPTAEAAAILLSARRPHSDGGAWLGLDFDPTRHRWRHGRLGAGLLGEAGIGLALVAVARLDPAFDPEAAAEAAKAGRAALLGCARRAGVGGSAWLGTDAFTGPAGTLYACARAATLADDPGLLEAALGLLPAVVRAAESGGAGRTGDGLAGGVLAALHLPESASRDQALQRLAELLVRSLDRPPEGDDVVDDPWAEALPSVVGFRALAIHRLRAAPGFGGLPQTALPEAGNGGGAAGDACVRAAMGILPDDAEWERRTAGAETSHRLLDWAEIAHAALCATTGTPQADLWTGRVAEGVTALRSGRERSGEWFGDVLAPDSRNLSAVHGVAAVVLVGTATRRSAPNVRVFG